MTVSESLLKSAANKGRLRLVNLMYVERASARIQGHKVGTDAPRSLATPLTSNFLVDLILLSAILLLRPSLRPNWRATSNPNPAQLSKPSKAHLPKGKAFAVVAII